MSKGEVPVIDDDFVTKTFLDGRFNEFKATLYQALFLQTVAIIGLTAAMIKLMK